MLAILAPLSAGAVSSGANVQNVIVYDTTAILSGKVLDTSVSTIEIMYQGGTQPTGEAEAPVNPVDGSFSLELDGLSAATTYTYNLADYATSTLLLGPLTFKTKNTIFGFTIGQISSGSVNFSGTVTSANPDLEIVWGPVSSSGFDDTCDPTITSKFTFSENQVDLTPNTEYKVMLVKKSDPQSQLSGLYTFKTLQATAVPSVTALGSTTATIGASVSVGIKTVSVYYGTSASSLSSTAAMTSTDGQYSADLTGLTPATNYFYKIGGDGSDPTSTGAMYTPQAYSFTTLQASTTAPTVGTLVDTVTDATGPVFAIANGPASTTTAPTLVPCGGPGQPDCNFTYLLTMINTLIGYLIFYIIPCIAVILILYAGFLLLTSAGNEEKVTSARKMLLQAVLGVLVVTIAWVLVKWVMIALGYNSAIFPTFY